MQSCKRIHIANAKNQKIAKKIKSRVSKQQKKNKGFSDKTLKKIIVTMHDLNGNHTYHIQINYAIATYPVFKVEPWE